MSKNFNLNAPDKGQMGQLRIMVQTVLNPLLQDKHQRHIKDVGYDVVLTQGL
jgi:hypothetical protein